MDELEITRSDRTVEVRLDRSSRANALSASLVEALLEIVDTCTNDGTRLLVFSGKGRHFCAGFDLGEIEGQSDGDLLWRLVRLETLLQKVYHARFLTIAFAHGTVVGAGVDLFCSCARRVAAPTTTFRMPGWRFGVALGTRRLIARVGKDAARSVLLASRVFDASEALGIGLADTLLAADGWPKALREARDASTTLDDDALAELLRISGTETRAQD